MNMPDSDRRILLWLILGGALLLSAAYIASPALVFRSAHSFLHASITYQIMNGEVPPGEPLLAGYAARYPWGTHLVAAHMSGLLRITPFHSFAVLNIVSFALTITLVYGISRLIIRDRLANLLSVLLSTFAITIPYATILGWLGADIPIEIRGIPALKKFLNMNCVPVGLVFFLLFVYSLMAFLAGERRLRYMAGIAAGALGCGFFYPPFLPGALAGALAALVAALLLRSDFGRGAGIGRALFAVGITGACAVVLLPYLRQISGGVSGTVDLFSRRYVVENLLKYLIVTIPLFAVILLGCAAGRKGVDRPAAVILWAVLIANAAGYVLVHMPLENEYKFLMLSVLCLGILGGIGFSLALRRYSKAAVIAMLAVFVMTGLMHAEWRLARGEDLGFTYRMGDVDLYAEDAEARALHQYIRDSTSTAGVFIDTEVDIPVFGRRRIFVPMKKTRGRRQAGYGQVDMILGFQSGYGLSTLDRRRQIADRIYHGQGTGIRDIREELLACGHGDRPEIYVVARSESHMELLGKAGCEPVFVSPGGTLAVCRLPHTQ